LGDLRETYDDHLRLIGKYVGDFLLMLIELFSPGRMAEVLRTDGQTEISSLDRVCIPCSAVTMVGADDSSTQRDSRPKSFGSFRVSAVTVFCIQQITG